MQPGTVGIVCGEGVGVNVRGWTENGNGALGLSWEWQVENGGTKSLWSPISSMLCHAMCVCVCAIEMSVMCTAGNMQQRTGGFECR